MARKLSDGMIHPQIVIDCVHRLQNCGIQPAIRNLEQAEPELANYLFETLSAIHQDLGHLRGPRGKTRRLYRQIELLTVACIESLRQSHYELWREQMMDAGDRLDLNCSKQKPTDKA